MKRLLVRMSALATVVVLGLIAIAQAQRSMGDRAVQDSAPEASESSTATGLEQGGRQSPVAQADAGRAPGLFKPGPGLNPLRGHAGMPVAGEIIQTSARSGQAATADDGAGTAEAAGEPTPVVVQDPFPTAGTVEMSGDLTGSRNAQSGSIAEAPPRTIPMETAPGGTARWPTHVAGPGPLESPTVEAPLGTDRGATAPAGPNAESPLGDRYSRTALPAIDSGQPARFELDRTVPSGTLPSSSGGAADRFSAPGTPGLGSETAPESEGTGTPGSRQLEGPQTPQLTIQKLAPEEIQVGKEAIFRVKVANTGQIPAHGVEIRDEVPKGARLVDTTPRASRGARGELVWELGTMQPGEEASVEIRLMPTDEGEIGSVATVGLNADASVRTVATKPELVIHTSAPSQVLIGQEMTLQITISNPGSGVATGVVLEEHVPSGFQHPVGQELDQAIGDLQPNETRQLELTLLANRPGLATNVLTARADANLRVEDRLEIEVIAPELDVALDGPKRRYLEREATYTLSVSNPGTAPARNVELIAQLPAGLDFVSANNSGQYQAASRTVHWVLEELPVQETGVVRLTTMPVESGEHTIRFTSTGEPGLSVEGQESVLVEGIAAILFQVVDVEDPIELGGETTYEIRVVNQGSKAATNVRLVAQVPPEMQPVAAEGPVHHTLEGNRILFESLPRLAPKADTTYRVRVQGLRPGDLRLRVQLLTDEIQTPVTKEESTRVYSDE